MTNVMTFYDKMTGYTDKERKPGIIHHDFRRHDIFIWKQRKYGL